MPEKRPLPNDGTENNDTKRVRSAQASPAPPALGANDDLERKKQDANARIAAIKARVAGLVGSPAPTPSPTPAAAAPPPATLSAAERIAAMKARIAGNPPSTSAAAPPPSVLSTAERIAAMKSRLNAPAETPSPPPTAPPDMNDRLAAAKAKARELSQMRRGPAASPPVREESTVKSRGGLNVGIHPSLLAPQQQTLQARLGKGKKQDPSKPAPNPYLADDPVAHEVGAARKADPSYDPSLTTSTTAGKSRKSRQLLFNQKGKFIAQANALRQQEKLEEMRLRMQEESRKKAIEEATEKSYLVPAPPPIEWWDEGLVTDPTNYDSVDVNNPATLNFDVITAYVQHPVLLAAPQESRPTAAKPMFLTKDEQKKVRRQRRMADHKEEQAKIRLGLIPPPAPKVKKSNLMRVLGQEAVKDPTAVEARVNREIAQRAADHEAVNEGRALTKDQRHDKLSQQKEGDAAKGIFVAVFRIDNLSYGKHRFQISKNAAQNSLTGITIFNPAFNLVVVEGGVHSISFYKKLMINRIRWTENAMPQSVREGNREAEAEWLKATDERGMLKDLGGNRCQLVFEGEVRERNFKRWIPYRLCETDGEAKDVLGRYKMENMWTLAQSMGEDVWA